METAAASQNQPYGVVYMIKNYVNGKCYVGQTVKSITHRVSQHFSNARNSNPNVGKCRKFYNAINKYSRNSFYFGIMKECESKMELDALERYYIEKYQTRTNGYNLADGGHNGCHSNETKTLIREKRKLQVITDEHKRKISEGGKGRILSEETRKKIGISNFKKTEFVRMERVKSILQMRESGMLDVEIREKLKISVGTFYKTLRDFARLYGSQHRSIRNDIVRKRADARIGEHRVKVPINRIIELYKSGVGYCTIARQFHCSPSTIIRRLTQVGIM